MSNKQRQIRVSGLTATTNIEVLRSHFEHYGEVKNCFMMPNVSYTLCYLVIHRRSWWRLLEYGLPFDENKITKGHYPPYLLRVYTHTKLTFIFASPSFSQSSNQALVTMVTMEGMEAALQGMEGFTFNGRRLSLT